MNFSKKLIAIIMLSTAACTMRAATFQELFAFPGEVANPYPNGLALASDGAFYGTTASGGSSFGLGTVFRLKTDGTMVALTNFAAPNGNNPQAPMTQGRDGAFYGTTFFGGTGSSGTAFRVTTNGILTTLVSFTGPNGAFPEARLLLANDGYFYGTTPTVASVILELFFACPRMGS